MKNAILFFAVLPTRKKNWRIFRGKFNERCRNNVNKAVRGINQDVAKYLSIVNNSYDTYGHLINNIKHITLNKRSKSLLASVLKFTTMDWVSFTIISSDENYFVYVQIPYKFSAKLHWQDQQLCVCNYSMYHINFLSGVVGKIFTWNIWIISSNWPRNPFIVSDIRNKENNTL